MKTGTNNRKQMIMAGVFGVVALGACVYIYEELFADSTPAPQQPVATAPVSSSATSSALRSPVTAGPAAKAVGTTSAGLDPTLHMDSMLVSEAVVYFGTGRNIFSATSVPVVPIPNPIANARPKPVQVTQVLPPQPTGPPPPPPIPLKYFGVATGANGVRKAFLLHDDIVYTATAGDVVLRQFKVIAVDAKTIQVEDMQNNNRQTLPLLTN